MSKRTTGLFAAPVRPVTQRPSGGGDAVDAEIADWVRKRKQVDIAYQLERGPAGGQSMPAAPMPQPVTVQDQIALSQEARQASSDVAAAYKGAAESERDRRVEAEQRAANAYEAGQQEAEGRWSTIVQMQESNHQFVLELLGRAKDAQVAAAQSEAARIAERTESLVKQTLETMKIEVSKRDEKISQLEQERQNLLQRETWDQALARVALGQAPEKLELLRRLVGPAGDASLTPEQEANRRWFTGQVDKKLASMDAEERRKDAMHGEVTGLIGALREAISKFDVSSIIPTPRQPGSVVPEWADDVPEEAQAAMGE